jgi:hypothetical protein
MLWPEAEKKGAGASPSDMNFRLFPTELSFSVTFVAGKRQD